jgi:HK97 family phage portal protein
MGRLKQRYNLHSRELSDADWALPSLKNATYYQSGELSQGADFFNLPLSPSGIAVTENTAMRTAAVYSCVEKIAVIASLPKHIYEQSKTGVSQRVEHDYWNLLNTEPSEAWTAASFWERTIASILLRGDGLAEIIRAGKYSPKILKIQPLYQQNVFIHIIDGRLKYKITGVNGESYTRDQDDILHFPGFGFNGYHGMSVIQYAAHNGIGIALAADQYSSEFFANGQRPDYVLTTDGTLSKEQTVATREALENQHKGLGNRFKPLVLQGGLKVTPISMTAEDSQLLETRKFQVVDVCMAFGVPPQLIGAQDSTSGWAGSSLEQLNLGFTKYTLRGHIARISQEINRKLFKNTKYYVELNLDAFLEGDSKSQAEYFSKAVGGPGSQGWMSVNEIRKLKNLRPDESNNNNYDNVIQSGSKSQPIEDPS